MNSNKKAPIFIGAFKNRCFVHRAHGETRTPTGQLPQASETCTSTNFATYASGRFAKREPTNWRFLLHKGKIFILKFGKGQQKNYFTFTAASSTIGFKLRLEYLSRRRKPYTPKITHRKPAEKPAITSVA